MGKIKFGHHAEDGAETCFGQQVRSAKLSLACSTFESDGQKAKQATNAIA